MPFRKEDHYSYFADHDQYKCAEVLKHCYYGASYYVLNGMPQNLVDHSVILFRLNPN